MSFFTSLTGLNAATAQLGVTSNNIANASTVGFKRSRADFGDIFATSPLQKATSTIGQGVTLKRVTQEFGQGNMNFSSNTLDLAISGDGFFPLKSADGFQDIFTRNGSFMMNDQYNVVNSAGQRLMAASVDSTGKANLNDMNILSIPQKTTGMAKETSKVQLGLNFPADAGVVSKAFNRNDPSSYNKTTALTVYDKGGNGYLATIYYAKTQNASQADPNNKWQTYVYVGDTLVAAALQQATDPTSGDKMYVNKYGQLKPESEVGDLLVNAKTQKFSLNQLTDKRFSDPAAVIGGKAPNLSTLAGIDFSSLPKSQLANLFSIDVDNTGVPVQVGLEHLAGKNLKLSGSEIAKELTNVLNRKFGDERYFNFAGQQNFQVAVTSADGNFTENRTIQLDSSNMTYEQVVDKINSQLNGSSDVLSNVNFSSTPTAGEFKGYNFTIGGKVLSGEIPLKSPLSTKPMEDLVAALQTGIQFDLQQRLGYTAEEASKVTVNVQNGNEIRVNDASGNQVSDLNLSPVSAGSPETIIQKYQSGSIDIATKPPGRLIMQIGGTQVDLDVSKLETININTYAQDLKITLQNQLATQGWSSFDIDRIDLKPSAADPTTITVTDTGGHHITQMDFVIPADSPEGEDTIVAGTGLLETSISLDNINFADAPFDTESLLSHFGDYTDPATGTVTKHGLSITLGSGDKATSYTIPFNTDTFVHFDGTPDNGGADDSGLSFTDFKPNDPLVGADHLKWFAADLQNAIRATTGNANLAVTWKADTGSLQVSEVSTSGSANFISELKLSMNTQDTNFGSKLLKGSAAVVVAATLDAGQNVVAPSSLTLSNVSFPLNVKTNGDEFESFNFKIDGKEYLTNNLDKLTLSSLPINDLAVELQDKIRSALVNDGTGNWSLDRVKKISVVAVNGKDLKISDAGGSDITSFSLTPKPSATNLVSVGAKSLSSTKLNNAITAGYDPVTQKFSFMPPLNSGITVALSGANNQIGITSLVTQDAGSDFISTSGAPSLTNSYVRPAKMQRYGLKVEYDTVNEKFIFKSGSTGDNSSISIGSPSTYASERLGILADGNYVVKPSATAVRGIPSEPAVMTGAPVSFNTNNNFSVNLTNNKFVVSVDDVKGTIYLEPKDSYTMDSFVVALQNSINRLAGPPDQAGLTGSMVSGVKVTFDKASNCLKFTTGTASANSFIKVAGDVQWGLANVEGSRGSTSSWIKPTQYTQMVNGVPVAQYIDEFGKETFNPDGFKALPEWSPIYLEKGELTFDTAGNLVSPKQGSQLDTVFLPDGKGALTINMNYSKSTQFSSPYSVLSQSQDGAPEGDLVGLSVGDDGLVNASYSNSSQKSLGKVVLVNFSNPTGLRQIGDTSYYKSSSSGTPKYGEAGSAGFGTVRSGATERANVDLTQELVDLITEQRNFQANAKAIETSTTLTQSIIQIRA